MQYTVDAGQCLAHAGCECDLQGAVPVSTGVLM